MIEPVKLAVVGAGLIGRRHADHIAREPAARLVAIADPAPEARQIAGRLGARWFGDLASLLASERPDGLIIATPTRFHVENTLTAISAGIPTLVEKPIADNVMDAEAMVRVAEASRVPLLVGHHRRHNPLIRHAKAIIEEGRLGRLVSVHAAFWLMKPDDYFAIEWRRRKGAGPVLTNLIHDIDLVRFLCGEIEAVQAFQSRAIRDHEVDETTVVNVRFVNGALGTFNISDTIVAPWSWEHTSGENPAYPRSGETCYQIGGTHGALSIPRLELWTNATKRSWWEPFHIERHVAADADPLALQIRHFCAVIRGEAPPLVPGREGLMTLKAVDAVQRAAETGETVQLM